MPAAAGQERVAVESGLCKGPIDPVAFVKRFAARIRHAHIKDHVGKHPDWEHRTPEQGELDYVPIVRAIAAAKFDGTLAVERFTDMKFDEAND